jgi:hypothetical protein
MCSTGTLDLSRADLMATAPSLEASTLEKEPLNWGYRVSVGYKKR